MKTLLSTICLFFSISIAVSGQGIHKLWGTTQRGGRDGLGTLFGMDGRARAITDKYELLFTAPGATPYYTNLVEYKGKFYGLTSYGGVNNRGVLFEWDPITNAYVKKVDFGGDKGGDPMGSLTLYNNKFYGMTTTKGEDNYWGVIFEWDPLTGSYSVKQDFDRDKGFSPFGSLTLYNNKFYGLTYGGGSSGDGVIFEWDPNTNIYIRKHSFDQTNGAFPHADLVMKDGLFYGMTVYGGSKNCGVIFEWNPVNNIFRVKQEFDGKAKGKNPHGSLTLKGEKFYGMTLRGGESDIGVIFEWDPDLNEYTKKQDFDRITKGEMPYGKLTLKDGKFYGITTGNMLSRTGALFEWDPDQNIYIKKQQFNVENKMGDYPRGSLTLLNGKLYGVTRAGGAYNGGVIFEWEPTQNVYTKKHEFNSSLGIYPGSFLSEKNGKFYGVTSYGSLGYGAIFEWNAKDNTYTKKIDLLKEGIIPYGGLTEMNGVFYCITENGPTYYSGSILKWDANTNLSANLINFDYTNTGMAPYGSLRSYNGKLYGANTSGGKNNLGIVFEFDPEQKKITNKKELSIVSGGKCYGSLTAYKGKFYGLALSGGAFGGGTIFEWDIQADIITAKQSFDGLGMGKSPKGDLTLYNDKFYGMTCEGGVNNLGVLFEWDPNTDTFIKKIDFDGLSKGSVPSGCLLLHKGKFYGMTGYGGTKNYGTVFEWDPITNIFTKTIDFDGSNGGTPSYPQFISTSAPTAKGTPGSCLALPTLTIDATNNNEWVPITDNKGEAIAEIKANGNVLGNVAVSLYVHDGAVREDSYRKLFLDRNITITPTNQPTTPVDVRFYVRKSEFEALAEAKNSLDLSSGVDGIARVGIYKTSENSCQSGAVQLTNPVTTVSGTWSEDYVLSASITSFSTFYFAHYDNTPLPLNLISFKAQLQDSDGLLTWKTAEEVNVSHFEVERSVDGKVFSYLGTVPVSSQGDNGTYRFIDKDIAKLLSGMAYYRLKMVDKDGTFSRSSMISLALPEGGSFVSIYPNPVSTKLSVDLKKSGTVSWIITDVNGKQLVSGKSENHQFEIDTQQFSAGLYFLQVTSESLVKTVKFVKQ